jgi:hypothetical protein
MQAVRRAAPRRGGVGYGLEIVAYRDRRIENEAFVRGRVLVVREQRVERIGVAELQDDEGAGVAALLRRGCAA